MQAQFGASIETDVDSLEVSVDESIPLAMIVNELVTNGFKHGCRGASGEVRLRLLNGPEAILLKVSDSGPGLPPGFDPARTSGSLGMKLIIRLVRQLKGTLSVASGEPGARFTVRLPHG